MNVRFVSKLGLSLFYLIVTVLLEIMTFCMLDIGFLPENFLYDFSFMLMFMGIIFIIPNYLAQYIVSMVMIVIQLVITYVNYTLYHLYGDVFSFDMVKLFNETKQAITSDFTYVWIIVFLVILALILGLVGFLIYRSLKRYKMPFHKNFSVFILMVVLIVQGLGMSVYTQQSTYISAASSITDEDYVLSDEFLRDTTMLKIASLKSLGTYGYYVNNIMNVLSDTQSKVVIEQSVKYFNSGDNYNADSSNVFGVSNGDNVIVIMLESLEWYPFTDGTENSYTFSNELTPNIYNLIQDGFIATDFFAKSKTNISEGIGFLGSYPIGKYMEQVTGKKQLDNYGFSMPNVLNKLGYTTCYLHSNVGSYYSRKSTHKYLGFSNVYCGDDAIDSDIKWGHWMKEEDFVYSALDEGYLIPENANEKPFYSFYTTVSSHGPYTNNSDNADQKAYKDFVKYGSTADYDEELRVETEWYKNAKESYPESAINYLVNYQASIVGLDKAIGVIVNRLNELGIYDNTTICLYSDHNAYYHTLSNTIKGVDSTDYSNTELNTIPFIIKSNGLNNAIKEKGYYSESNPNGVLAIGDRYGNEDEQGNLIPSTSRFSSAYDIVPTLLDLLGIEFNRNFYPGNSLFTNIETMVSVYDEDGNVVKEPVIAYYSHTGGVYGKYGHTKDMQSYEFEFPNNYTYGSYTSNFKIVAKQILLKLNYVSTLYSYGVYSKLNA